MQNLSQPIISCKALHKSYGHFDVLNNVSFSIQKGEKIGIVGQNGAGKTTLLKILAGEIAPDQGEIYLTRDVTVGYIPQDFTNYHELTARSFLDSLERRAAYSEQDLSDLLSRLHLDCALLDRRLSELSGGERTKMALARILLSDYELLLLDEPTNNLDIPALTYLEDFVRASDRTFLVISHDRTFLDNTVTKIFEIDASDRLFRIYSGNFTSYLNERNLRIERMWQQYTDSVQEERRLKKSVEEKLDWKEVLEKVRRDNRRINPKISEKPDDTILRDKEGRMGRRARVIKDRLARFQKEHAIEKPKQALPLQVDFQFEERSGDKVYEFDDVRKTLPKGGLGPLNLSIRFGERILFIGSNGAGKTTLLKLLLGDIEPDSGVVRSGAKLNVGYLPQMEYINPDATVREEFLRHVPLEEGLGRRTLHRFKLEAEDVGKKIKELSSGERSRLTLAMLMARKVNCLVLDEPSNHLDLEVLESLEGALARFKGTLILVSHDRYFIDHVGVGTIYQLENGELKNVVAYT